MTPKSRSTQRLRKTNSTPHKTWMHSLHWSNWIQWLSLEVKLESDMAIFLKTKVDLLSPPFEGEVLWVRSWILKLPIRFSFSFSFSFSCPMPDSKSREGPGVVEDESNGVISLELEEFKSKPPPPFNDLPQPPLCEFQMRVPRDVVDVEYRDTNGVSGLENIGGWLEMEVKSESDGAENWVRVELSTRMDEGRGRPFGEPWVRVVG